MTGYLGNLVKWFKLNSMNINFPCEFEVALIRAVIHSLMQRKLRKHENRCLGPCIDVWITNVKHSGVEGLGTDVVL